MKKLNHLTWLLAILLLSCSPSNKEKETDENAEVSDSQTSEMNDEAPEEQESDESSSLFGSYTLTAMNPITGDKELTDQDTEYIDKSKERTLNNTKLTLNEDGTFERVFPHPAGDGSMRTWTIA